jgi:F-type H+-transporting ATPase subunit b
MADQLVPETHTEAAREEPGFPPFNAATFPSQLLWFAIVFVVLYLLMGRVALPRVGRIFEARRTRIAADLDQAAALQRQAEEAGAAYEKTLADAKANAQALAQQMRERLAADSEARRKELETSLNAKLAAAESQIAGTRTQAMANVGGIAADTAAAIVERLTGMKPNSASIAEALAALKLPQ